MDVINISVDGNFEGSGKSVGPEAIRSTGSLMTSLMMREIILCAPLPAIASFPPLTCEIAILTVFSSFIVAPAKDSFLIKDIFS